MALLELIRFRKLDSELTDDEFFNKFCKKIGRDLIISALHERLKGNLDETQRATKIQSNILLARESESSQPSLNGHIDELP